jgi:hypothetical protein
MSDNFLINLKGSYFIVPIVVMAAVFLTFLDSKISKDDIKKNTYFKIALLTGVVALFVVFVNTIPGSIKEEILTGPAPF